jgi:hypothetical protein
MRIRCSAGQKLALPRLLCGPAIHPEAGAVSLRVLLDIKATLRNRTKLGEPGKKPPFPEVMEHWGAHLGLEPR